MLGTVAAVGLVAPVSAQLMIDFGNPGVNLQSGYEEYGAGNEVAVDFDAKTYTAFSTTVTVDVNFASATNTAMLVRLRRKGALTPIAREHVLRNWQLHIARNVVRNIEIFWGYLPSAFPGWQKCLKF